MKLHGLEYGKIANHNRISTAGEVQNPDFGYKGDNIRGFAVLLWLKPYDTPEFPLRAATLFDYEDCKGHSIALFETAGVGIKVYDSKYLRLERFGNGRMQIDSVMVPDGLRITINRWNYSTEEYDKTSETDGTKEHKCVALEDAGSNSDYWQILVETLD